MGKDSEAEMHEKYMEMSDLLDIYLSHFPSFEKYALTNRIRNNCDEVYDHMVDSQMLFHKKTSLTNMDRFHNRLRMNVMKAFRKGYFKYKDGTETEKSPKELEVHRYLTVSLLIDELGRMIGGWIRDEREKERLREEQKKQQREVS